MTSDQIIALLPYQEPFLFVDTLHNISEKGITGTYTFKNDEFFYKGHFKENSITPGVILTETMAQIGVVSLGIYLLKDKLELDNNPKITLTSHVVDFFLPVYPNETVTVISKKEYFRFNKLKCKVKILNSNKELICRGLISGMISPTFQE
ncbi:MAG: hydroxymyristoyl-ACP dehydratase [Flavobacteriaceae bacterium]|nr:hydroxymyristoyl-ACP dehydratase [Flavobacteriaceae bacterium]